jgi:hypothetical protein
MTARLKHVGATRQTRKGEGRADGTRPLMDARPAGWGDQPPSAVYLHDQIAEEDEPYAANVFSSKTFSREWNL